MLVADSDCTVGSLNYRKYSPSAELLCRHCQLRLLYGCWQSMECVYKQVNRQQFAIVFECKAPYMFRPLPVSVCKDWQSIFEDKNVVMLYIRNLTRFVVDKLAYQ